MSFVDHDPRQIAPGRFFGLMDLTTALFAAWVIMIATGALPRALPLVSMAWSLSLFVMFFRRGQDEFWDHCWRAATTAALLALVTLAAAWSVFAAVIERRANFDIANPATLNFFLAVLFSVFFGGFQWARFRGEMA